MLVFMGVFGGYFRLVVGILLSLEVIRLALTGGVDSVVGLGLSLIFLLSTAAYVIRKVYFS